MRNENTELIKRGVYFLANDRVIDLTVAFLNSFRKYNPDIALCLIPYNSECKKIKDLKEKYKFEIFQHNEYLEECDNISFSFHGKTDGSYRKLVMWEGGFEEFIYVDIDTVVLKDISFAFNFLSDYDFVTSQSSLPALRQWVWKDSVTDSKLLTRTQIEYSANTGFITSKKSALPFFEIRERLEKGLQLKPHMVLYCQEQPFLNYCIVTSNRPYSSLFEINKKLQKIFVEVWAGIPGGKIQNDRFEFNERTDVFLVHWAGLWKPRTIDNFIYNNFLKFFGGEKPVINSRMPYKKLWLHYRFCENNLEPETIKD